MSENQPILQPDNPIPPPPSRQSSFSILTLHTVVVAAFFSIIYLGALYASRPGDIVIRKSLSDLKMYAVSADHSVFTASGAFARHVAIFDESSATAGFAVGVESGSFADSPDYQGLAHFLEHMVFLGNSKYPAKTGPESYDSFISSEGGHTNAFTDNEVTVYYSSVHYDAFTQGLDRFLHLFINPAFAEEAVASEINAVDSEHNIHKHDAKWRILSLIGSLTQEPANLFSTGSSDTLLHTPGRALNASDPEAGNAAVTALASELRGFFEKHYCANRMHLVTFGPFYAVDQLNYVRDMMLELGGEFATGCTSRAASSTSQGEGAMNDAMKQSFVETSVSTSVDAGAGPVMVKNLGHVYRMAAPADAVGELWVVFPLRSFGAEYRKQPLLYLETVLTFGGRDSIKNRLVQEGLITGMDLWTDDTTAAGLAAMVAFTLTAKSAGSREFEGKIVSQLFMFLEQMKQAEVSSELYENLKLVHQSGFDTVEAGGSGMDLAKSVANQLARKEAVITDILTKDYLIDVIDVSVVREILLNLTVDNSLVVVYDPTHALTSSVDNITNFANIPYEFGFTKSAYKDGFPIVNTASNVNETEPFRLLERLTHLPPSISRVAQVQPFTLALADQPPTPFTNESAGDVWRKKSLMFPDVPKGSLFVFLRYAEAIDNVEGEAYGQLVRRSVLREIYTEAAELLLANNDFDISMSRTGIEVSVHGWKDHLDPLMDIVFKQLFTVDSWASYDRALAAKKAELETVGHSRLSELAVEYLDALTGRTPTSEDVLTLLKTDPTQTQVMSWLRAKLRTSVPRIYVAGLFSDAEVAEIVADVKKELADVIDATAANEETPFPTGPRFRTLVEVRAQSEISNSENTALAAAFSLSPNISMEERVWLGLVSSVFDHAAFASLRTVHGLGYIVSVSSGIFPAPAGAVQLRVVVQGAEVSPDVMDFRLEELIGNFTEHLSAMPSDEVLQWVESQIGFLSETPGSRQSELRRFWPTIRDGVFCFTKRQEQIDILKRDTLEEIKQGMIAVWSLLTGPGTRSKIAVKIFESSEGVKHPITIFNNGLTSFNEEVKSRWLADFSSAYVLSDGHRFKATDAILNAAATPKFWEPSLPECKVY